MSNTIPMTYKGYEALKNELKRLRAVERPRIVAAIEVARAHGDLKENAEYHAAKEEQGMVDARMKEIDGKLSHAEIINPKDYNGSRVLFGCHVTLYNLETDQEITYQIVGEDESDLTQNKISYKSPIARAVIGKEEGDEGKVKAPRGDYAVEVSEVTFK